MEGVPKVLTAIQSTGMLTVLRDIELSLCTVPGQKLPSKDIIRRCTRHVRPSRQVSWSLRPSGL